MLWSHGAFIEIESNFRAYFIVTIPRGKKFYKTNHGFNFLGGSFVFFHYQEKLYVGSVTVVNCTISLREKCLYSEFLCSLYCRIWNNTEKKKHFSRSDIIKLTALPTCNFYTITCGFPNEDRAIMKFVFLANTEGLDKNDRNHEWQR